MCALQAAALWLGVSHTVLSACLCTGFFPIYWISRAVIHLLVLMVETTAFTTKKAVYYTIGTRVSSTVAAAWTRGRPLTSCSMACLLLMPRRVARLGPLMLCRRCTQADLPSSSTCPIRCCRLMLHQGCAGSCCAQHYPFPAALLWKFQGCFLCRLLFCTSCC